MAKKPIAQQVVVVTGGTSGIGRAIAREAASRGAGVVVAARGEDGLAATAEEIGALAVRTDVASREDCDELVARTLERFGRIDTFVASAFVSTYAELERLSDDELRRIFDVNVFGRVNCLQAALPALKDSRGTFVDVNSALAYRGVPLQSAYCATKAAMRTLLESARTELRRAKTGVDVVVILPGAINTPHFDRVRQKIGLQPMPVPPIYEPETMAPYVVDTFERPVRELPVGWGAQKLLWGQKLAPRLADAMLLRSGWEQQQTGEQKPADAPDNLWDVLPGDPGARGRFGGQTRARTAWTALRSNRGTAAGAVGALALLATMRAQSRR